MFKIWWNYEYTSLKSSNAESFVVNTLIKCRNDVECIRMASLTKQTYCLVHIIADN